MRILAVSDRRHKALYDYFDRERWRDIDLVISCGDIDAPYLSFLVTVIPKPLLYVPGNHDESYLKNPPEGCDSLDDRVIRVGGGVLGGLGGSYWYNGKDLQYTERQMMRRGRKLVRRARSMGGLDILVTHAPPRGIHDQDDQCHRGFETFREIIRSLRPKVLVHGHNHEVYGKEDREAVIDGTRIINAYEYYSFDIEL
jgi:Icc-related predicted phosphoesterase